MQKLLVELTQRPEMQIESRETKGYIAVFIFLSAVSHVGPRLGRNSNLG